MEYKIRVNNEKILECTFNDLKSIERWIDKLLSHYPKNKYEIVVEIERYFIWQNHRFNRPSTFKTLDEAKSLNLI